MTITVLCLEVGAFGETFADEIAAALEVQILDLRPLDLGMAEWHLFCHGAAQCDGGETHRLQPTPSEIEERSVRLAVRIVEGAKGDALVVGWSGAVVLAPLRQVTRVCIRAPRPQGARRVMWRSENDTASTAPHPTERPELHHSRFTDRTIDPKWLNLDDFDLILDAGRMSAANCQREIVALVKRRCHLRTAASAAKQGHHSTPSRELDRRPHAWQKFKGCTVTVGADDLPLAGTDTQEAAIARIEQHLHGRNEMLAPANPLCRRASD